MFIVFIIGYQYEEALRAQLESPGSPLSQSEDEFGPSVIASPIYSQEDFKSLPPNLELKKLRDSKRLKRYSRNFEDLKNKQADSQNTKTDSDSQSVSKGSNGNRETVKDNAAAIKDESNNSGSADAEHPVSMNMSASIDNGMTADSGPSKSGPADRYPVDRGPTMSAPAGNSGPKDNGDPNENSGPTDRSPADYSGPTDRSTADKSGPTDSLKSVSQVKCDSNANLGKCNKDNEEEKGEEAEEDKCHGIKSNESESNETTQAAHPKVERSLSR